jgi:hypothetical protein
MTAPGTETDGSSCGSLSDVQEAAARSVIMKREALLIEMKFILRYY